MLALDLSFAAFLLAGTSISTPATIPQGRQSGYSSGITYDVIADASRGSDTTGDGSLAAPYKTATKAAAIAVASGGTKKKIALRGDLGQTYTDIPPTISTDNIEIHGYQTEVPNWEASYTVTGWAACTSGDANVLGAKWANCYKATFTISGNLFHTAYNALLPTENGTLLNLAQLRRDVSDLFIQSDPNIFYSSAKGDDVTITASGGSVTTISHPSVLGNGTTPFTDAQLGNMAVLVHASANKAAYVKVASASSGVLTLTTPNGLTKETVDGDAYSLLNAGPAIQQGQYVWKDNGDGTLTLYVYPNNPANLASGVKIAARDHILTFSLSANNKVSNICFRYVANDGSSLNQGPVVFDQTTGGLFTQNIVEYFSYKDFAEANGPGTGPVVIIKGQNNTIQYNDLKYGQNQFGPFLNNNSTVTFTASGNRLLNNYMYRLTLSPFRCYGQTNAIVADNLIASCGFDAHAGKGEFYLGCDHCAVARNGYIGSNGYMAFQDATNMWVGMNVVPSASTVDCRAIVDQSNGALSRPTLNPSTNYCVLNLAPKPESNTDTSHSSIVLTANTADTMNWYAYGNVGFGLDTSGAPAKLLGSGDGVYTKTPTVTNASDTVVSSPNDIFYDVSQANWNTVPGSVLTTKTGATDLTSIFTVVEGWFPTFNFRLGIDNLPITPATPHPGPYGGPWPVQADTTAPTLSGLSATISGASATCSVSTSERGGRIYWERYNGGSVPTGAQVVAGLTAAGGAPLSSGSFAVGDAGAQPTFTVTGTAGQTDTLAVVHQDRNGNISTVATTSLAFAAYTPTWTAFDGVHFLRKSTALTGFQASTKSMFGAFAVSRNASQLTTAVTGGVLNSNNGSLNIPTWSTGATSKHQFLQEDNANVQFVNVISPSVAETADVQYIFLVGYTSSAGGSNYQVVCVRVSDGALIGTNQSHADTDRSLVFGNGYDLFKAAATYERLMLWDNAYADPTLTATQRLFVAAGGGLVDPATAVASLGAPLINVADGNLATGANAGSGGNFAMT